MEANSMLTVQIEPREFARVCELLYRTAGINITKGKEGLVMSRLGKRLRALGLDSYQDYLAHIEDDASGAEFSMMVDVLTTNKTSFFREDEHFTHLREHVLPTLVAGGREIRIWSAACSSGEEPYTIAMVCTALLDKRDAVRVKILATDISSRMLAKARAGSYSAEQVREVPAHQLQAHFTKTGLGAAAVYVVDETIRSLVRFAKLNLMETWPMQGRFDIVFCRNVMIYFDPETQSRLVRRFHEILAPGGHLFVGHSESLTSRDHAFRNVRPAVYVK